MNILDATCEKLKTSLSPFIFAKKVAILNNQGYVKNIFIYKELINFYSKKAYLPHTLKFLSLYLCNPIS